MRSAFLFFILIDFCAAHENRFIEDEWFTNNCSWEKFDAFVHKFNGSLDGINEIYFYSMAVGNGLNPIMFAARFQAECSGLTMKISDTALSYCMGYGVMDSENKGFDKQVSRSAKALAIYFRDYRPGMKVQRYELYRKQVKDAFFSPENAASFAHLLYNPVYGLYQGEYDWEGNYISKSGNAGFEKINEYFKKVYEGIK